MTGVRFGSLGLIIIGTQLHGNATYLGPAITFCLLDLLVPVALGVEIGRKVTTSPDPATDQPPA